MEESIRFFIIYKALIGLGVGVGVSAQEAYMAPRGDPLNF